MNKRGKSWHLIVTALLIVVFSFTALFGVSYTYGDTKNVYIKGAEDIRFGIDIRGGVDVTFMPADGVEATDDQMTAAKTVIEDRLVGLGITDYEDYVDYNKDRIIVRFPWKTGETDFNPQTAIDEIGTTAEMVFRKGSTADGEEILSGDDVTSATAGYNQENGYVVQLQFSADGAKKFAEATTELAAQSNGTISIWLDGENISTATVKTAITDGNAVIEGSFTQDQVTALANQINSGSLPFALSAESFSTISPTLGAKSLDVMVLAGIIAFAFVALLMIVRYRLPGTIAVISLFGQVVATLAFVSGYFTVFNGSTLTLPGIAGIILGIGMGVDANVITAERIKEELGNGKTLDGAIASGFKMGLTPIIDGNVTIVIVAALLMGAFGPTDGFWGKVFNPIFFMFGPSTAGSIYSFGFTLLTSVLLNFVFGVFATRIMIRGASRCKVFRNPVLYGGSKDGKKTYKCPNINFVGNRKKFYTFSGVLVAVVLVFSFVFGVTMDIEFKGGAMVTVGYQGDVDLNNVKQTVAAELGQSNLTVQTGTDVSGAQTLTINLPGSETLSTEQLDSMTDGFAPLTPALLPYGVKKALTTASTAAGGTGAEKTAALRTLGADLTAYYTRLEADAKFGTPYSLPPATADQLGGVKVGEALDIAPDGTLSGKTLNDKIAAAVAVKSEPRLVWNHYEETGKRWKTYDIKMPDGLDYVHVKTKYNSPTGGYGEEVDIAKGSTANHNYGNGTGIFASNTTFRTDGTLHFATETSTSGYTVEIWLTGYHYPTLADLLTQVTAVESSVTDLQVALCELYEEKEEN